MRLTHYFAGLIVSVLGHIVFFKEWGRIESLLLIGKVRAV